MIRREFQQIKPWNSMSHLSIEPGNSVWVRVVELVCVGLGDTADGLQNKVSWIRSQSLHSDGWDVQYLELVWLKLSRPISIWNNVVVGQ